MTHSTKLQKTLKASWRFSAIGTSWSIETPDDLPDEVKTAVTRRIGEYDKTYSRFRDDSFVTLLRTPGTYTLPSDAAQMLRIYKELHAITNGRMTPLIGATLEAAGYDATYSFKQSPLQRVPDFSTLGWGGDLTVTITEPILLDVGAAGKGYLVDIVSNLLNDYGVHKHTIDASGDVLVKESIERVGLEHPDDPTKIIGVSVVSNESLCASAVNRRTWKGLHHVFDGKTQQPTKAVIATWVISETALVADALATALFFVEPEVLQQRYEFESVIMKRNGDVYATPGFKGELFI